MNSFYNPLQFPAFGLFLLYVWSMFWKGLALWKAAGLKQKNWFIALLVISSLGILEILYLFFFAEKKLKLKELKFWDKS